MRGDEQVAERVRVLLDRRDDPADPDGIDTPDDEEPGPDLAEELGSDRRPSAVARLLARIPARVPVRLDPGRRAALAVGVAVLVAALVTGGWMLASRPRALTVSATAAPIPGASSPQGTSTPTGPPAGSPPAGSPSAGASQLPGASPAGSSDLVVDVAGKVVRPGLYHLPQGSRVADAVSAAGGVRRGVDLTAVNLAARISDGQLIVIGVPGAAGAAPSGTTGGPPAAGGGSAGASASAPVDLNNATLEQLETLPGIGPALGQRILDWRTAHGSFASVDQLNDVSGIGDVKFAALKPLVTT